MILGVKTGRFSTIKPNISQIPKTSVICNCQFKDSTRCNLMSIVKKNNMLRLCYLGDKYKCLLYKTYVVPLLKKIDFI